VFENRVLRGIWIEEGTDQIKENEMDCAFRTHEKKRNAY
jgi:hypothetical protein